jgi:hypothetical protein
MPGIVARICRDLRWFWSLTVTCPMTRSDRVASLEEAKAQFQNSWHAWTAWAKLEERLELQRYPLRGGRGMGDGSESRPLMTRAVLRNRKALSVPSNKPDIELNVYSD